MKYRYLLTLMIAGLLFSSCEEQQVMVPEFMVPESNRVVLLEELTGASCPNCPQGTAEIENIMSLYGELVIPIGIHGDFLSWPTAESKYDFRNEDAKALENYLKPWGGKPAAAINRVQHDEDELSNSSPAEWTSLIDKELEKQHVLDLFLTSTFDETSRELKVVITAVPRVDLGEGNRISLMILESEIEDAQEDNNTIIEDYEHNHVLRDAISQFDGDPIQKDLIKDEIYTFNFDYVVPTDENLWVAEHLEIVAFVHKDDGVSKEVFQAAHGEVVN